MKRKKKKTLKKGGPSPFVKKFRKRQDKSHEGRAGLSLG
jgi:hypothetical protein